MLQYIGLIIGWSQSWLSTSVPPNTLHLLPYLDEKCLALPGRLRHALFPAKAAAYFRWVFGHHSFPQKWEEALGMVVLLSRAGWMQCIGMVTQAVQDRPKS